MEERLLKFVGLVDSGSYTKAANSLHISQPALTMAIKQLERELGQVLLIRHRRDLKLTPAGKNAYIAGKEIKASTNKLDRAIHGKSHPDNFSIGMIDSVAARLIANEKLVEELFSLPNVSIWVNNTDRLLNDLQQGRLDYVIGTKSGAYDSQLVSSNEVFNEKLIWVSKAEDVKQHNSDIASGKVIDNFIAYNPESNTYKIINDHLNKQEVQVTTTIHSTSPELTLQLVISGKGSAFLPRTNVEKHLKTRVLGSIGGAKLKVNRPIWSYTSVFSEALPIIDLIEDTISINK
jgi:LysR family transcriptional regulator, transcriptional activator of the cysJI operon